MTILKEDFTGAFLYCFFDNKGRLLYAGSSRDLLRRLGSHRRKSWWNRIDRITFEKARTLKKARRAERDLIKRSDPVFNGAGTNYDVAAKGRSSKSSRTFVVVDSSFKEKLYALAQREGRSMTGQLAQILKNVTI